MEKQFEFNPQDQQNQQDQQNFPGRHPSGGPSAEAKGFFAGRRFRQGSAAAAITVCTVVLIILVNVVFGLLSDRYVLQLDLTAEGLFGISDETKTFLDAIGKDVRIYVLTRESVLTANSSVYYTQTNEIMRQFDAYSPRLTLEYVDLARNPGFNARFPQFTLDAQSVILESPDRAIAIKLSDMFNVESSYDNSYQPVEYIASSRAEQALANALSRLLAERQITVSILGGFGEQPTDALEKLLSDNQFQIIRQDLITEQISAQADAAILCAPSRDYTEEALGKLDAFLYNDGNYGKLLFYLTGARHSSVPNLGAFLADWGIAVDEGIILQTDPQYLVTNSYYWSIAGYSESVYAKSVTDAQKATVMPEARPLSVVFDRQGSRTVQELLAFSESACVQPTSIPEGWTPEASLRHGPIPAMLLSRHVNSQGGVVNTSSVLVSASTVMAENELLSTGQLGNGDYILSLFNALTPQPPDMAIPPKAVNYTYLTLSQFQVMLMAAVFIVVLPLAVIASGCVVFFRRRHL